MTAVADPAGGLCNLRDLGGLPTGDGGRTRPGVLYRSDLPLADDGAPASVPVWPPATVLDLRAPAERRLARHPLAVPGTTVHTVALIDDARLAGAAGDPWPPRASLPAWFAGLYGGWLRERPEAVARAVDVAARSATPLLVHCAAGRDRTGVVVALLLSAAGVQRDAVVADYRRTEGNQEALMVRLAARGAVRTGPGRARLGRLATPEAIERVLDHVDAHPGGVHGWLTGHGADAAALERWKATLVGRR